MRLEVTTLKVAKLQKQHLHDFGKCKFKKLGDVSTSALYSSKTLEVWIGVERHLKHREYSQIQ